MWYITTIVVCTKRQIEGAGIHDTLAQ